MNPSAAVSGPAPGTVVGNAGSGGQTVGMVSLGCPKNLVDGEVMLGRLQGAGYQLVPDAKQAD